MEYKRNFNPLPPRGGRHFSKYPVMLYGVFQSTPSAWRETPAVQYDAPQESISIHSLRVEGDRRGSSWRGCWNPYFNPLPPRGGRRPPAADTVPAAEFQSTPSAWRETPADNEIISPRDISIHSLRVEGDQGGQSDRQTKTFQSTPSAWRETDDTRPAEGVDIFQSTPSAWRETVPKPEPEGAESTISIHSLRVEGDR